MHVVSLFYCEDAELIESILYLARPTDEIEGEAKEVLTLHVAPDGTILRITPPPRCKFDGGIKALYLARKRDEEPVDR